MRITYATLSQFASDGDSVANYILSQWDNEIDQCYEDPEVGYILYHVSEESELEKALLTVMEGSPFLTSNTNGGDGYEDKGK